MSCTSATSCLVGGFRDGELTLAHWDGTQLVPIALPVPDTADHPAVMHVACGGPGGCLVLARSRSRSVESPNPPPADLAFRWDGTTLHAITPLGGDPADLACTTSFCVATRHTEGRAEAVEWDGSAWTATTLAVAAPSMVIPGWLYQNSRAPAA